MSNKITTIFRTMQYNAVPQLFMYYIPVNYIICTQMENKIAKRITTTAKDFYTN